MLLFAYGSNLDAQNWEAWCEREGYDVASIQPLRPAWLPDHRPIFHYRSRLREGGALDIVPSRGHVTPGALFEVHDWAGVDAKEGVAGGYYERVQVTVLTDDGRAHQAITYRVHDSRVVAFEAPTADYLQIVRTGLARFGHEDAQMLAVAAGEDPPPACEALFVYGTLMRGHAQHERMVRHEATLMGRAHLDGLALFRIDWYPGAVLAPDGRVHGELYEAPRIYELLADLDEYEDFEGYDQQHSVYRRVLMRARSGLDEILCWTYIYLGPTADLARINTGRWTKT